MGVEQSSFFSLSLYSCSFLLLWTAAPEPRLRTRHVLLLRRMERKGRSQHKEIGMQWAHVNGALEGHGENVLAKTEDGRRIKEGMDYWEKQQKGLQPSLELGREMKTLGQRTRPATPYYLQLLYTRPVKNGPCSFCWGSTNYMDANPASWNSIYWYHQF